MTQRMEQDAIVADLQARLAAAEAECRAREDVQTRLIRERNAAEARAERAVGLLWEAREQILYLQEKFTSTGTGNAVLVRINALFKEVADGR